MMELMQDILKKTDELEKLVHESASIEERILALAEMEQKLHKLRKKETTRTIS